jgi:hypothetical protein
LHRRAIHFSLAWSLIAECERWHSGIVRSIHLLSPGTPSTNKTPYQNESVEYDLKTIGLFFPKQLKSVKQAVGFMGAVLASVIIWATITWILLWLMTVVLFQDYRMSVLDSFILATWRSDCGRQLWWGMQFLLWFPMMNVAKAVSAIPHWPPSRVVECAIDVVCLVR